jgi:hypothetical protein
MHTNKIITTTVFSDQLPFLVTMQLPLQYYHHHGHFMDRESVLKGDSAFIESVQKSAYVICSNGAPG